MRQHHVPAELDGPADRRPDAAETPAQAPRADAALAGRLADPRHAVRVEIRHHRHEDHPGLDIPQIPEDLYPPRAAALLGQDLGHRPLCAIVEALRPGETARVRSDHEVGPLCHAIDHHCAERVAWELEQAGPEEWTVLLHRR